MWCSTNIMLMLRLIYNFLGWRRLRLNSEEQQIDVDFMDGE